MKLVALSLSQNFDHVMSSGSRDPVNTIINWSVDWTMLTDDGASVDYCNECNSRRSAIQGAIEILQEQL